MCLAFCSACLPTGAAAEAAGRIVVAVHSAEAIPRLEYQRRNDPANRTATLLEGGEEWRTQAYPLLEANYRIADHVGLEAQIARLDVPADVLVRRTVRFLFFPLRIGVRVPVRIESESIRLSVGWLAADPVWGGSALWAGIQGMRLSASYELPGEGSHRDSVTAPLPALGATVRYRLAETVTLMAKGSYAPAYGKDLDGDVAEAAAAIEWQPGDNALLGLGYRDYRFRIALRRTDYDADASLAARGPMAYLGWSF
jgi:hypothetical protein